MKKALEKDISQARSLMLEKLPEECDPPAAAKPSKAESQKHEVAMAPLLSEFEPWLPSEKLSVRQAWRFLFEDESFRLLLLSSSLFVLFWEWLWELWLGSFFVGLLFPIKINLVVFLLVSFFTLSALRLSFVNGEFSFEWPQASDRRAVRRATLLFALSYFAFRILDAAISDFIFSYGLRRGLQIFVLVAFYVFVFPALILSLLGRGTWALRLQFWRALLGSKRAREELLKLMSVGLLAHVLLSLARTGPELLPVVLAEIGESLVLCMFLGLLGHLCAQYYHLCTDPFHASSDSQSAAAPREDLRQRH